MRQILLLALALLCAPAQAQFACLPFTVFTPTAVGSESIAVETTAAEAEAWWCPTFVDGATRYRINTRWALKKYKASYDWSGSFARVKAAPDLLAALNAELAANKVTPPVGSMDEYEVKLVRHRACLALTTPPYLIPVPEIPAGFCGPVPTPPAPQAATWLTPNSVGLKVYNRAAGDKLGSAIAGRTAPPNNSCNPNAPKVTLGTSTYYPLSGGPLNELVLCRLVQ